MSFSVKNTTPVKAGQQDDSLVGVLESRADSHDAGRLSVCEVCGGIEYFAKRFGYWYGCCRRVLAVLALCLVDSGRVVVEFCIASEICTEKLLRAVVLAVSRTLPWG